MGHLFPKNNAWLTKYSQKSKFSIGLKNDKMIYIYMVLQPGHVNPFNDNDGGDICFHIERTHQDENLGHYSQ